MKPYYDHDGITIYHGDCREILPPLEPVDLVLTDPPYDIVATGGGIAPRRPYLAEIKGFTDGGFDVEILNGISNWMVFCAKSQLAELITLATNNGGRWMLLTWNKPDPVPLVNGNYLPDTEYVVHAFQSGCLHGSYRDRARFIVHPTNSTKNLHPNEKPLPIMKKLVNLGSSEGSTILDPFMGSGTTLRAAKDLGRKAIGIEIEERYCEVAANRMAQGVLL